MLKYTIFSVHALLSYVCMSVLVFMTGYSLYQMAHKTPLMNTDMRVGESWYSEEGRNTYHPASYYLEKAHMYLAQAREKNTAENLRRTTEMAYKVLETRPNNAFAWLALGVAYAADSQPKKSQEALVRTYALAPYHRNISLQRLQILQAYWSDLTPDQQNLVLGDIRNLQSVNSWKLDHMARMIPNVQTLIDLANTKPPTEE